jgi:hypothetical protein
VLGASTVADKGESRCWGAGFGHQEPFDGKTCRAGSDWELSDVKGRIGDGFTRKPAFGPISATRPEPILNPRF